jgi:hypothetical protein
LSSQSPRCSVSTELQPIVANLNHDQNIATITLNNPEKLNALDLDGYFLLGSLLRQVAEMPSVTITLITGTGRYFSASVPALPLQRRASSLTSRIQRRRRNLHGLERLLSADREHVPRRHAAILVPAVRSQQHRPNAVIVYAS